MDKKTSDIAKFIETMLLPVILGLAAGISGGMIAYAYFTIGLTQIPATITVGRVSNAVTAPLPESDIAERLDGLVLPIFRPSSVSAGDFANRSVRDEEAVGHATVLTSDGWLMTHEAVAAGEILIGVDGKLKSPSRVVRDPRTGAIFLKIDNGSLQVTDFEETELLGRGVPLFALDAESGFVRTSYGGPRLGANLAVSDADTFNRLFPLQDTFSDASHGGAVLTLGGNLAGILSPEGFIPMHLVRSVLSDAFRNQALDRPTLGVRYVDLGAAFVSGEESEARQGARITGSRFRGLSAVKAGSPAADAGLIEGDVILRVEDVELSGDRDLAELVADYRPGNAVELEILRGSERRLIEVALE